MILIIIGAFATLALGAITLGIKFGKQRTIEKDVNNSSAPTIPAPRAASSPPTQSTGLVVKDCEREVMEITILDDTSASDAQLASMTNLPQKSVHHALKKMIEPLLQVAPTTGTAIAANSSKLMEVVINGELLAASDGNGYRAIAKATKGFEHARLHEPSNLQNAANAAAIWQLVSVVVAQKHLADISAAIQRIESQIGEIQTSLEDDRSAIIKSVIDYLSDAREAIEKGEFLERTRTELERFDFELNKVEHKLNTQIMRESKKELERDKVGCGGEYRSALAKHKRLSSLTDELVLCNETRLANWYLCSLYPDDSEMLIPRLSKIKDSLDETQRINEQLVRTVEEDCALVSGTFTTNNTVHERRSEIRYEHKLSNRKLTSSIKRNNDALVRIETIHADRRSTSRFIVEAKDGAPTNIYFCH